MFQKLLIRMLPMIISNVTPEIKKGARALLDNLKDKAKQTPNPYDDMLVDLLDDLLAI